MKYRLKPIIVDAVQWTGKNQMDIGDLIGSKDFEMRKPYESNTLTVYSRQQDLTVKLNYWVIKDVEGFCYTRTPGIFKKNYEPI